MFSILLLTTAALVSAQLDLPDLDLSAIAGITVDAGVATVDAAANIDVEGTLNSALKVVNDAVLTVSANVVVAGELVVMAGSKLVVEANKKVVADKVTCGTADGKGSVELNAGSTLMVNGAMALNADECDFEAEEATLLLAAEAEADAKTTIAAGSYAVAKLEAQGKSELETAGDVVIEGAVTARDNAKVTAQGAFETTGAIVLEGNAKLQTSGDKAVKAASATMASASTYVAVYKVEASESKDVALEAANEVKFDGELMLDVKSAVKAGDEFVLCTYGSHSGEFKTVVDASASASASAGRKRASDDWEVTYGEKEAKAKYTGEDKAAAPGAADSASTLAVSAGAALMTLAALF